MAQMMAVPPDLWPRVHGWRDGWGREVTVLDELLLSTACVTVLSLYWCHVPCPCSCLRRRADLPDPHRPDQHHCTRSSHGILPSTSHPAGRRGCAEERSASHEEQACTFWTLFFPSQLCIGPECRALGVLIFPSHVMKGLMKNLPLFKDAKQKCTSTIAVCCDCETFEWSVRFVLWGVWIWLLQ